MLSIELKAYQREFKLLFTIHRDENTRKEIFDVNDIRSKIFNFIIVQRKNQLNHLIFQL